MTLEHNAPVSQDLPKLRILANISQQRAHWDGELKSRTRAVDARVSHGVATTGECWSSSSRCDKATLSACSFIATKVPAWTFVTSFAWMCGNEGDIINGVEDEVVLGSVRSVPTGMWVVGVAVMGITWAIDASGGIPLGVNLGWGGWVGAGRGTEPVRWYCG